MKTKQTIAIIGAGGHMGTAIAKALASGNYRLLLFSGSPEKAGRLASEIMISTPSADVDVAHCPTDASWEADIIILALPYGAERDLATRILDVSNQKIVVSISNPVNGAMDGLLTQAGSSAAEELQDILPNSKVVKAFNTVVAAAFRAPQIGGQQVDAFLAGNDADALDTVSGLVQAAGLNPVIAGDLSVSRTLESMALLLIQLTVKNDYDWLAGWKVLHN